MTRHNAPLAAAAAAVLALALPAAWPTAAQPLAVSLLASWETPAPARVEVPYAAGELHTAAGARALARRIRIAADKACGGESLLVRTGARFTDCKTAAIDRALSDLNAP